MHDMGLGRARPKHTEASAKKSCSRSGPSCCARAHQVAACHIWSMWGSANETQPLLLPLPCCPPPLTAHHRRLPARLLRSSPPSVPRPHGRVRTPPLASIASPSIAQRTCWCRPQMMTPSGCTTPRRARRASKRAGMGPAGRAGKDMREGHARGGCGNAGECGRHVRCRRWRVGVLC